ncbi:MAG: tripartite tricarboxylate transporter TctB family protein [Xanthobacteraceae bacterium]
MIPSRSLNSGEIAAALVVCALGGFLIWQGSGYPLGSLNRMGPGFFPVGLGIILMGFGAALVLEVKRLDTPPPEWHVRSFVAIMAGLLAFALMLEPFGLVPATVALAVLSSLGDPPLRPRAIAATALALAGIGYFVFLRGFGVQLDAFRW